MVTTLQREIQATTNYSIFSFLKRNRFINRGSVNKLKEAISAKGYRVYLPILVNKDMEIIDGQHRFTACREMGLPIYYQVVDETDDVKTILDLNTLSHTWQNKDYVHCYAEGMNQNYVRLENLSKEIGLSPSVCLAIAQKGKVSGSQNLKIKAGEIKFSLDNSLSVRNFCARLDKIAMATRLKKSTRFIMALVTLSKSENFNWNNMISKAEKYPTRAYPCRTEDEFLFMLKDLYNYNIRKQEQKLK